jgi:hypothetical protein
MKKEIMYFKNNEIKYCQVKLGGGKSTDSQATERVEDSSVEDQDTSLREASGASKTFGHNLVEVHGNENGV